MNWTSTPQSISTRIFAIGLLLAAGLFAYGGILHAAWRQEQSVSLPKAEEVLDRYIQVTGGKAAFASLNNILSKGAFEVVGTPMRGTYTAYEAQPNKTRTIFEFEGGDKDEQGTLGDVVWASSAKDGPSLRQGEEKAIALREATFNSMLNWRKLYRKAECAGTEKIGEKTCYKIVLTPEAGRPLTQFFDTESGFLVKSFISFKGPNGDVLAENLYDDYREANVKILFPHKLAYRVGDEVIVVVLNSVRCNVDIAWYRFDLSPDIKALQAKKRL